MDTPNLGLPFLMAAQAQKHVTHNEALRALDALVHLAVIDRDATSPPGSPAEGDRYIVATGATGAWDGHDLEIAAYQDGGWAFFVPRAGWRSWVGDEELLVAWTGTAWSSVGGGGGSGGDGDFDTVGINATADTTNRLAIAAAASLFTHVGAGHQQKINKAAAADTASVLYQTGFEGRAEIGLTGDDDFHVKVSPDGSAWNEAILIDKDTGEVSFPSGVDIDTSLPAGGTTGQVLAKASNDDGNVAWSTPAGGGDMLASVYDPGAVAGDAFDMDNMAEGDDTKIMTADERSKLAGIEAGADVTNAANVAAAGALMSGGLGSVTQPYDADLAAIAALTTTSYGRALLALADAAALAAAAGLATSDAPQFAGVGINATADTTDRLAIAAASSLFNHAGNGHQQKINKAAAGDTASVLYQTGYEGRAEMGTTGDDDFHFKVSPDGSVWTEALVIDTDTGKVDLPAGFADPVGIREAVKIVTIDEASYESLDPPDVDTIYLITDAA